MTSDRRDGRYVGGWGPPTSSGLVSLTSHTLCRKGLVTL